MRRSEVQVIEQAIRARWDLDPAKKQRLIERLFRITEDEQSSGRDVVAAARALLTAEAQNQADERREDAKQAVVVVIHRVLSLVPQEHKAALEAAVAQALSDES